VLHAFLHGFPRFLRPFFLLLVFFGVVGFVVVVVSSASCVARGTKQLSRTHVHVYMRARVDVYMCTRAHVYMYRSAGPLRRGELKVEHGISTVQRNEDISKPVAVHVARRNSPDIPTEVAQRLL